MTGAGISTAAGIPDFRSPKIGLYASIKEMTHLKFRSPTFVFDIDVFMDNPKPFWWIFNKLWPRDDWPLPTNMHYFISLLNEKGILLRNYTQNVDSLEIQAGLPPEKVIQCHGSLTTAHCQDCHAEVPFAECLRQVAPNRENLEGQIEETVVPICPNCGKNHVKPDVTFFGEDLPEIFYDHLRDDFEQCDLLIVAGTALQVYPFAGLVNKVKAKVPRYVINMDPVRGKSGFFGTIGNWIRSAITLFYADYSGVFDYGNGSDFFIGGDCQESIMNVVTKLNWGNDFEALKEKAQKQCKNPIAVAAQLETDN
ncbi:NAD-dependent protein deacetylase sirtuin-2 [Histomonas meleagridis]|uniref:NAD-dependent protein deacetylase sirtuin-2 n=1 Tax=Histomonas meleagridis TaxID=135588 RepID=UPI00355951F8|nr:NAD-dependent protein deacetylase sirtuin-2 [Histomonas meleagridis]KAH0796304.1 NAD-dependent protein deacetylase sirtuin-2 [Histomonas meleagridis]